jgi:hypothetical protein
MAQGSAARRAMVRARVIDERGTLEFRVADGYDSDPSPSAHRDARERVDVTVLGLQSTSRSVKFQGSPRE